MENLISLVALVISIISLIVTVYFAVKSMQNGAKANALSESQKTAALISIVSPACESPEQWRMFIDYLSKNDRLPSFSKDDEFFLANVLNRLEVKAKIVNGRLEVEG